MSDSAYKRESELNWVLGVTRIRTADCFKENGAHALLQLSFLAGFFFTTTQVATT